MKKIFFLFLLFNSLFLAQSYSINDKKNDGVVLPVIIDSIRINGNKTTEPHIILNELTFKEGDKVDSSDLKFNRERVYSLGIFNYVNLNVQREHKKNILVINVEESWYIYPIPFIGIKDRDWNKVNYGINFRIHNLRGRNETVRLILSFGYDPEYFLFYSNPYLIKDENISFDFSANYSTLTNKSDKAESIYGGEFEQKFISTSISLGKRFNLFNKLFLSLAYNYIETPKYFPRINISNDRIDRNFSLGLKYIYDSRDLAQFPNEGLFTSIELQNKGLGIDNINYQIFNLDFREYRNLIKNFSAKWRFALRTAFGNDIPYYDYSYFGFRERIRGHYFEEIEGKNMLFGSLELKYPIIKEWNLDFDFPIIPKSLQSFRIALYTQIFTDTGYLEDNFSDLKLKKFNSGYGLGFTLLILPYNMARLEFGFDENGKSEVIFDVGLSF